MSSNLRQTIGRGEARVYRVGGYWKGPKAAPFESRRADG